MKKRTMTMLVALLLIASFAIPATAVSQNVERANNITFSMNLYSIRIPDSTEMLSKGVVKDGVITYEATVRVQVKNNGTGYANQAISWATTASSTDVKLISNKSDTKTGSAGVAYGVFHVRNIEDVPVKVTCGGVTSPVQKINIGTRATYVSDFRTTQYIIVKESDYSGELVSMTGLTGKYKKDFLADVKVNGSGIADNGKYVKFTGNKYSHDEPKTASGTTPEPGQTIAVDSYVIPRYKYNGAWRRGYVTIQDNIGRRIAEDTGGRIEEHRIDIFMGEGKESLLYGTNGLDGMHSVLFMGVNSWGHDATRPATLAAEKDTDVINLEERYTTQDDRHVAYISTVDFSKANSFTVSVADAQTQAYTDNVPSVDIPLSTLILSIEELRLDGDKLIAIGNVNPSLQVYQEFDVETQELVHEYYGYGFVKSGETVIFVQAPQHFSDISGHNMIVNSNGCLLYESGEDETIRGNLKIEGNVLSFEEMNSNTGEIAAKTLSIDGPVLAKSFISYYD